MTIDDDDGGDGTNAIAGDHNYLDPAYMGKPPAELGPEEGAEIPARFQEELRQRRDV